MSGFYKANANSLIEQFVTKLRLGENKGYTDQEILDFFNRSLVTTYPFYLKSDGGYFLRYNDYSTEDIQEAVLSIEDYSLTINNRFLTSYTAVNTDRKVIDIPDRAINNAVHDILFINRNGHSVNLRRMNENSGYEAEQVGYKFFDKKIHIFIGNENGRIRVYYKRTPSALSKKYGLILTSNEDNVMTLGGDAFLDFPEVNTKYDIYTDEGVPIVDNLPCTRNGSILVAGETLPELNGGEYISPAGECFFPQITTEGVAVMFYESCFAIGIDPTLMPQLNMDMQTSKKRLRGMLAQRRNRISERDTFNLAGPQDINDSF